MSAALKFAGAPHPATSPIKIIPTAILLACPGAAPFRLLVLRGRLYRLIGRKVDFDFASHRLPLPISWNGRVCERYTSATIKLGFLSLIGCSVALFTPEKKAADYRRLIFSGVSPGKAPRRLSTPLPRPGYFGPIFGKK